MSELHKIEYWILGIITAFTVLYVIPKNIIQVLAIETELSIYYWIPSFLLVCYCFIRMITLKEK